MGEIQGVQVALLGLSAAKAWSAALELLKLDADAMRDMPARAGITRSDSA